MRQDATARIDLGFQANAKHGRCYVFFSTDSLEPTSRFELETCGFLNRRSQVRLLSGAQLENRGFVNSGPDGVDQTWTTEASSEATARALQVTERVAVLAELYLRACAARAPCNDLAEAMAKAILESEVVRLAQVVLKGGEHRHAWATELAARVLDANRIQEGSLVDKRSRT